MTHINDLGRQAADDALLPPARHGRIGLLHATGLVAAFAVLVLVPQWLSSSSIGLLADALVAALFAMSFNLLYGQAGMLSFGHGAYLGIGTFAAIHVMRAAEADLMHIPTPLIPLVSGVVAMIVGFLVGLLATRRTGVYFSLITVAFAEIMLSIATPFDFIFGGEGGFSSWRPAWLGIAFGNIIEVYYLVLFWVVVCILAMYYWTGTPLGRVAVAIRDNDERVSFLGYNVHLSKTIIFALSTMFAGVAGGLLTLSRESTTYLVFSGSVSAEVVLNAFIGGVGVFLGPAVGAAIMTLGGNLVSGVSRSWPLYQGLLFVIIVMFLPDGIAGLFGRQYDALRHHGLRRLLLPWSLFGAGAALITATVILSVEIAHRVLDTSISAVGMGGQAVSAVEVFGVAWKPFGVMTWVAGLVGFFAGVFLIRAGHARASDLSRHQSGGAN
jgi:branched-chain amino acid transport system permease protein